MLAAFLITVAIFDALMPPDNDFSLYEDFHAVFYTEGQDSAFDRAYGSVSRSSHRDRIASPHLVGFGVIKCDGDGNCKVVYAF